MYKDTCGLKTWANHYVTKDKQKTTKPPQPKRPANPPARFAFRLKAKQRSNKERGGAQQKHT